MRTRTRLEKNEEFDQYVKKKIEDETEEFKKTLQLKLSQYKLKEIVEVLYKSNFHSKHFQGIL